MSMINRMPITPDVNKLYNIDYKKLQESGVKLQKQKFTICVPIKYKEKIKTLNQILGIYKNYIEIKKRYNEWPQVYPIYTYMEFELYFENAMDDIYNSFLNCIEPIAQYIINDSGRVDFFANVHMKAWRKAGRYEDLIKMCKAKDTALNKRILELDFESKQEAEKKKTQAYNSKLKFRENKTRLDLELNPEDAALFNQIKKEENLKSNIDVLRFLMKNHLPAKETLSEDDERAFNIFYENYKAASDRLNILALLCNTGKTDTIKPDNITDVVGLLSEAREYIFKISDKRNVFKNADIKEIRKIRNINSTLPKNASQIQAKGIDTEKVIDIFSVIKDETYIYVENR